MNMTFADMGRILEIHGPRAQLDGDGQIKGGLERGEVSISLACSNSIGEKLTFGSTDK